MLNGKTGILPCGASCCRICLDAMEDKMRAIRKSDFGELACYLTDTQGTAKGSDLPYLRGGVATMLRSGEGPTPVLSYKTKRCLL